MDSGLAEQPNDLVKAALESAQGLGRGVRRRRRRRPPTGTAPPSGGYSGPAAESTDPQPVGAVFAGYAAEQGWDRPLASGRLFADWPALVGADVAAHCRPTALVDGVLRVEAVSTAWATQLRLLAGTVLARLAGELGPGVVAKLHITGPVAPSWKHGSWSVRGGRGPRDTYG